MSQPLNIIIVERLGNLKALAIKDFKEQELFKKCGFKKAEDFIKQTEWNIKYEGKKYSIYVFAKSEGRANSENKYDFPPPIDTKLFYGSCAIIATLKNNDGKKSFVNLTIPLWNKIYEKLFGGFEDITTTAEEDENEEDELKNIPKEKKTKDGYLKDGFVIDSSDTEDNELSSSTEISDDDDDDDSSNEVDEQSDEIILEDIGSELSEETYDYDSDNVAK